MLQITTTTFGHRVYNISNNYDIFRMPQSQLLTIWIATDRQDQPLDYRIKLFFKELHSYRVLQTVRAIKENAKMITEIK